MSIQGILFDLDGTLADTLPLCIQSFQNTVYHFTGERPAGSAIVSLFGISEEGMLVKLLPGHPIAETLAVYLAEYERLHDLCPRPFTGLDRVFDLLAQKSIRAAIVTGKGPHSGAISLRVLGLDRWIDRVEYGFPDRSDKTGSMLKVLEQWNLPPDQAAYVGDTLYDMHAAREAGLLPLGAAWSQTSELRNGTKSGAAQSFHSIDAFLAWIQSLKPEAGAG
ncbi:MAG TPA: HAD hydrolase-like protein [Anaerolineaceae bacterium]|nr:HAD hydrolase-like protein [Anaerolineaceae bacterium]